MANRRGLHIFIRLSSVISSDAATHHPLRSRLSHLHTLAYSDPLRPKTLDPESHHFLHNLDPISHNLYLNPRHFSSRGLGEDGDDEDDGNGEDEEEDDGDGEDEEEDDGEDEEEGDGDGEDEDEEDDDGDGEDEDEGEVEETSDGKECRGKGWYTAEKAIKASKIGYEAVGPLDPKDHVFKSYKPVFAVVQIGSHQFKVSNEDVIYTERLKFCKVNDKLVLNKVLLFGTKYKTIVGRPILPDATVHAVVEEHALDAKVIIFKKKRRKNYRRTNGHRQELTRLRITGINGFPMSDLTAVRKLKKATGKDQTKKAVAA